MSLTAYIEEIDNAEKVLGEDMWVGGGDIAALRLYRAHHPGARIYPVTYRGRSVWMTLKQFAIWRETLKYQNRGERTTLAQLAKITGASRATVSRFLRRLDLWRFLDVATIVGRNGGTFIFTRVNPFMDADMWDAGAKVTMASRKKARFILAQRIKREAAARMRALIDSLRRSPASPPVTQLGITDATFGILGIRKLGNWYSV